MNFMNEMENQENKILEEQESQAYEPVEFEEGTMDASVEGEYRADEIQVLDRLYRFSRDASSGAGNRGQQHRRGDGGLLR